MSKLKHYSSEELLALTTFRAGEQKLGQLLATTDVRSNLAENSAKFVLLGICEDIGIQANGGKAGAANTWVEVLTSLCNVQSTEKLLGSELLVLGCLTFEEELKQVGTANTKQLRALVAELDDVLSELAGLIFSAGKVPIFIGGGHNNAYPILQALSKTHQQAVNALNIDAHADFRALEGRHSGNGFSYAFHEGFLDKYAVVGLHENYNSQPIRIALATHPGRIQSTYFEDFLTHKTTPHEAFEKALRFTDGLRGLELDLDSIAHVSASAASPCGFTPEQVRSFLYQTKGSPMAYLHVCEGVANSSNMVAKLISYFITDFVKAQGC